MIATSATSIFVILLGVMHRFVFEHLCLLLCVDNKIFGSIHKKGKRWQEEKYKNDQLVGLLQDVIWNQMKCFTFDVVFWPHWDM
jgi:hypothetical protein